MPSFSKEAEASNKKPGTADPRSTAGRLGPGTLTRLPLQALCAGCVPGMLGQHGFLMPAICQAELCSAVVRPEPSHPSLERCLPQEDTLWPPHVLFLPGLLLWLWGKLARHLPLQRHIEFDGSVFKWNAFVIQMSRPQSLGSCHCRPQASLGND